MKIYENGAHFFGTSFGLIDYAFHMFNLTLLLGGMIGFAHIFILVASLATVQLAFLYIRAMQNCQLIKDTVKRFNWGNIQRFIRNDVRTFEMVFIMNQTFGKIFLAFILVNCPINAYLVMVIMLGKASGFVAFVIITFGIQQVVGIFLIHLGVAYFTKQIHHSGKLLIHLIVENQHKVGDFRTKFILGRAIHRIHTKRRYGITYGGFGLITLKTFVQVRITDGSHSQQIILIFMFSFFFCTANF